MAVFTADSPRLPELCHIPATAARTDAAQLRYHAKPNKESKSSVPVLLPHVQLPMPYFISKPNTVLVYLYAT
jgi:hypothetical protein